MRARLPFDRAEHGNTTRGVGCRRRATSPGVTAANAAIPASNKATSRPRGTTSVRLKLPTRAHISSGRSRLAASACGARIGIPLTRGSRCRPGFGSSSLSSLCWPSLATSAGDDSPGRNPWAWCQAGRQITHQPWSAEEEDRGRTCTLNRSPAKLLVERNERELEGRDSIVGGDHIVASLEHSQ
jgi:hypothetical protein